MDKVFFLRIPKALWQLHWWQLMASLGTDVVPTKTRSSRTISRRSSRKRTRWRLGGVPYGLLVSRGVALSIGGATCRRAGPKYGSYIERVFGGGPSWFFTSWSAFARTATAPFACSRSGASHQGRKRRLPRSTLTLRITSKAPTTS